MLKFIVALAMLCGAHAQQKGTIVEEVHQPFSYSKCTKSDGCSVVSSSIVIDSNWRWTEVDGANCYTGNAWNETVCPSDEDGAQNCGEVCALEGAGTEYKEVYGVRSEGDTLNLTYVTNFQSSYSNSTNAGSRVYVMDGEENYKMFYLKNRELSIDVDYSNIGCGLNGAIYFVEMDEDGGKSEYSGNQAGAAFGTGYCDAQCPHDMKFINGEGNTIGWESTDGQAGQGQYGTCCNEMDIFEANQMAYSYTPHVCTVTGQHRCLGTECGDIDDSNPDSRYEGVCDKDGCDFAPYRLGAETFYGPGPDFKVDTSKPFTVVTQFITTDGTDVGDLSEIRRVFIQDGVQVENPTVTVGDQEFSSITDEFCATEKVTFGDHDSFTANGGLKAMGESLDRGHVFVMSLWDDNYAQMLWLDSTYPVNSTEPGALRGPCSTDSGKPDDMRNDVPNSNVAFSNIKFGEIGSTFDESASHP